MSNVISLKGGPLPPAPEPVPDVILALEDMLEEAMAGRIIGIACAALHPDSSSSRISCGWIDDSTVSALVMLQARIALEIMEYDQ